MTIPARVLIISDNRIAANPGSGGWLSYDFRVPEWQRLSGRAPGIIRAQVRTRAGTQGMRSTDSNVGNT
jgi:hypothetical protein